MTKLEFKLKVQGRIEELENYKKQLFFGPVNDRATACIDELESLLPFIESLPDHSAVEGETEFDRHYSEGMAFHRVLEWHNEGRKKKANTAFTAGLERTMATLLETVAPAAGTVEHPRWIQVETAEDLPAEDWKGCMKRVSPGEILFSTRDYTYLSFIVDKTRKPSAIGTEFYYLLDPSNK